MDAIQQAASLALAQVNLIKAEVTQQAINHSRHFDTLQAIKKRIDDMKAEADRIIDAASTEGLTLAARVDKLETEVQHFINLNKILGNA